MSVPVAIVLATVAALVIGGSVVVGAPVLAIPILLLLPGPIMAVGVIKRQRRRRQIARFREQARARKIDFDARDEQTLV